MISNSYPKEQKNFLGWLLPWSQVATALLLRSMECVRTPSGEREGGELDEKKNKGRSLNFEKGCHPNPR